MLIVEFNMLHRLYRKELQNLGGFADVEEQVEKQFSSWFKNNVRICFIFHFNIFVVEVFSWYTKLMCTDWNTSIRERRRC
jgi:hypothetical protein